MASRHAFAYAVWEIRVHGQQKICKNGDKWPGLKYAASVLLQEAVGSQHNDASASTFFVAQELSAAQAQQQVVKEHHVLQLTVHHLAAKCSPPGSQVLTIWQQTAHISAGLAEQAIFCHRLTCSRSDLLGGF